MGAPLLNFTSPPPAFDNFLQRCFIDALDGLVPETFRQNLRFEELATTYLQFQTWMTVILLHSNDIELRFSLHFEIEHVQKIAEATHGRSFDLKNERNSIIGVLKEICNTVAGNLRNRLFLVGIESGFSLPMLVQGFDHIIINKHDGELINKNILVRNPSLDTQFLANYLVRCQNNKLLNEIDFSKTEHESLEVGHIELL